MRRLLKALVTNLLSYKARAYMRECDLFTIAIIGGRDRGVFRDQLHEYVSRRGYALLVNQPGMNFRLGLSLTVLRLPIGGSSWRKWLQSLWTRPSVCVEDIYIQEFAATNERDIAFLASLLTRGLVVLTPDVSSEVAAACIQYFDPVRVIAPYEFGLESVVTYGSSDKATIELIAAQEEEGGTVIQARIEGDRTTLQISKFGEHYFYSTLIAEYCARRYEVQAIQTVSP